MGSEQSDSTARLAPDDAFTVLANETRIEILRALGEADEPLGFSALHEAVDIADSGQFNYHLDKLVGHFVEKSDEGYALRRPGRQVIEAVLSGAVTDDPQLDRTSTDQECMFCGSPTEIQWREGSLERFCTECAGSWRRSHGRAGSPETTDRGYLGRLPFPPAGLDGRTPTQALKAAWTWTNLEILSMASGLCPRCAATLDTSLSVCEDHDSSDGLCAVCDSRQAVVVGIECTNCLYSSGGAAILKLLDSTDLLAFLTEHGLNPISPDSVSPVDRVQSEYEEEVIATDPFEGRFTFQVGDDRLTLHVGEELAVLDATRTTSESSH